MPDLLYVGCDQRFARIDQRNGRALASEHMIGRDGTLDHQNQPVCKCVRIGHAELPCEIPYRSAQFRLAFLHNDMARMTRFAHFDGKVAHRTAMEIGMPYLVRIVAEQGAKLLPWAGVRSFDHSGYFRAGIGGALLQAGGNQIVLGLVSSVEAGLGDACLTDDLVNAHSSYAASVE